MKKATTTISKATKGIICIIISIVSGGLVSSYWFSWAALLPLLACIGGLIVFLGLWIEKEAEEKNNAYCSPFSKPFKKVEDFGWWILMAGIALEVITAGGITVIEDINAAKNNPFNAQVDDVSAVMAFSVRPTYSSDLTPTSSLPGDIGSRASILLCGRHNTNQAMYYNVRIGEKEFQQH